ncbi:MAG TPA: ATP-binding cassette domain-containing protein, partial [Candidatus Dormibacteraeota bacterium]
MSESPGVADGARSAQAESLLTLRGIDKHFGPVQALYGVNLDLPAGQVTGLCGDNGAGKSVLTRCIAGVH